MRADGISPDVRHFASTDDEYLEELRQAFLHVEREVVYVLTPPNKRMPALVGQHAPAQQAREARQHQDGAHVAGRPQHPRLAPPPVLDRPVLFA